MLSTYKVIIKRLVYKDFVMIKIANLHENYIYENKPDHWISILNQLWKNSKHMLRIKKMFKRYEYFEACFN